MCSSNKWLTPMVKQVWVVSTVLIMMIGHGMVIGIASSMVPDLQAPDSPIKIDLEEASWLSASVGIGSIIMFFCSPYFMAIYGRRGSTLIGLTPAIAGPLICYSVSDINIIIFGRFVSGIGIGAIALVAAVVIGEYTSPKYRGVFLNLKSAALIVGSTIAHILGHYFHWRTVMLTITIPYVINFAMAYTWPESPSWLAANRRYEESTNAFYWLRGKSEKSIKELTSMIAAQKETYVPDKTLANGLRLYCNKFKQKNFLKPVGVYFFAAVFLESSGRHVFPAYAIEIVKQMNPEESSAFYYTMCIDLLIGISAFISTFLVKIMKRRTLLFSTGVTSIIIILSVCLYYFLQSKSLITKKYDTIALVLFGSYFVISNTGCTPICLTLIGEIFPLEHRPTGASMAGVLMSVFMFVTLKITPIMLVTLKMYGTFAVFGVSMAVCLLVLYFTLPETKDKTLQEIEDYFSDRTYKNCDEVVEEKAMLTDGEDLKKVVRTFSSLDLKINDDNSK